MPTHVKSLSRHKISGCSYGPVDWLSLHRTGGSAAQEYSIKVTKARSKEKIDGIVAAIMALDRCIRNQVEPQGSVYDNRGILVL